MKTKLILVVVLALSFASLANAKQSSVLKEGYFVDHSGQVLTTFCIDGVKWILTRHSSRGVEMKKSFVQDDLLFRCSS